MNFIPKMGQLHQGTFIYAFEIIKNRFGGPLKFFFKKIKTQLFTFFGITRSIFALKSSVMPFWKAEILGFMLMSEKYFKIYFPMRNKHPSCHNLGKKILSQKSFFECIFECQKKNLEWTLLSHFSKAPCIVSAPLHIMAAIQSMMSMKHLDNIKFKVLAFSCAKK